MTDPKPWYFVRPFESDLENIETWFQQLSEQVYELHVAVRHIARLSGIPPHGHVVTPALKHQRAVSSMLRFPDNRRKRDQVRDWMECLSSQVEDIHLRIEHVNRTSRTALQTATTPGGGSTLETRMDDTKGREEMLINPSRDMTVATAGLRTSGIGKPGLGPTNGT